MPENIPEIDSWKPDDLNNMFERIVVDFPIVHIHSLPSAEDTKDGPWVLTIDNFLTDKECERLIEMGHELGYERSTGVGTMNFDDPRYEGQNGAQRTSNEWHQMLVGGSKQLQGAVATLGDLMKNTTAPDQISVINAHAMQMSAVVNDLMAAAREAAWTPDGEDNELMAAARAVASAIKDLLSATDVLVANPEDPKAKAAYKAALKSYQAATVYLGAAESGNIIDESTRRLLLATSDHGAREVLVALARRLIPNPPTQ